MSLKSTFRNLFELVKYGILTNNSVALYLYYKLNQGRPTPMKTIRSYLQLSTTAISLHNKILRMLDLVILKSAGVGKPNIPIEINSLSDEDVIQIKSNEDLLLQISDLKDKRYHCFAPGSYYINSTINKGGGVSLLDTGVKCPDQLKIVLSLLPKRYKKFQVTRSYLSRLVSLAEKVDLTDYTKWFVKKKLGKTVNGFSLGIFLFDGMIEEYNTVRRKRERVMRRKSIKNQIFSDSKIAKEFGQ